jgi:hypothetical protein
MSYTSPRHRKLYFFTTAAITASVLGLGGAVSATASSSTRIGTSAMAALATTTDLWDQAQSAPVQSPVNLFPNTPGAGAVDLSQVRVGRPPGFGNAGEIHRFVSSAPAGSAVTVIPVSGAANGLGGTTFPYITSGAASANLALDVSVVPGTPTGTRTLNLLSDPVFGDVAKALDLTGAVYVMGADRTTGLNWMRPVMTLSRF